MRKFNIDRQKLTFTVAVGTLMIAILTSGCSKAEEGTQSALQDYDEAFVGMCFDDANPEDTGIDESSNVFITNLALEPLSCQAPHDNEVYYIHRLPANAEAQLEKDEFFEDMLDVCEDEFEDYIGSSYQDSYYEMSVLFPTTESWKLGHRNAICYAFHPAAKKLDFELKGVDE